MTDRTSIEWADSTFNPWIGCTRVGPGCDHCYAEAMMDTRRHVAQWGAGKPRVRTSAANWNLPRRWNKRARLFRECSCGWRGDVPGDNLCPECRRLEPYAPARRRVFCASLADVFDNEVDPRWRSDLFELIRQTPTLDWLLLTKRIGNARTMLDEVINSAANGCGATWEEFAHTWPNVWLGATVVNQAEADRDIPKLLAVPAAKRFLSIEPMLGPMDLTRVKIGEACGVDWTKDAPEDWKHVRTLQFVVNALRGAPVTGIPGLDWVIAGGESGRQARPSHPEWFRSLREQCSIAGVPFLFKQWGEWAPGECADGPASRTERAASWVDGQWLTEAVSVRHSESMHRDDEPDVYRLGKKKAGRALDGCTHSEWPA